jgi:hypothetical protein
VPKCKPCQSGCGICGSSFHHDKNIRSRGFNIAAKANFLILMVFLSPANGVVTKARTAWRNLLQSGPSRLNRSTRSRREPRRLWQGQNTPDLGERRLRRDGVAVVVG